MGMSCLLVMMILLNNLKSCLWFGGGATWTGMRGNGSLVTQSLSGLILLSALSESASLTLGFEDVQD